jgi:glyoxylase-like metal-dependent hydrolase (beta-lactamase superfamily II)
MVYFPEQHAIATGDLFLTRSSPAMDEGSVKSWIRALDQALDLPVEAIVPGHFELAGKPELQRFRDYLKDLYLQVQTMHDTGASVEAVRRNIKMEKYSDFRQYPKYEATFADNAETVYHQLQLQ